jgi:hypothetical protein
MEAAADRLGISHDGLFADTTFIPRTTGQRWADRAEREGQDKGSKSVLQGFELLIAAGLLRRFDSTNSPFSGVKLDSDGPATDATVAIVRAIIAAHNDERRGEKSDPAPRAPKLTPQRRKVST